MDPISFLSIAEHPYVVARCESEIKSSFLIALRFTTSRRILASASTNQGPEKGDLVAGTRSRSSPSTSPLYVARCSSAGRGGNDLQRFKDFYLKAKAGIWP